MSPAFMIAIANKQLTDNAAGRMLYFFHVRIDDDRSLRDHPRFAPWQPIRPINQQSNLGTIIAGSILGARALAPVDLAIAHWHAHHC